MSTQYHEGVTCDCCMKSPFSGLRYKCLVCFDYDLCQDCYLAKATSNSHKSSHSMQCILTKEDANLILGMDHSAAPVLQSFACPFCPQLGFSPTLLETHIQNQHKDKKGEQVVCPICSTIPGGHPNHMTDDLANHILSFHKRPINDIYKEELSGASGSLRQMRRLNHPTRVLPSQRFRNNVPLMQIVDPTKDSISEILSQLTVARSIRSVAPATSAAPLISTTAAVSIATTASSSAASVVAASAAGGLMSHFQHLEMQLDNSRQQLERFRNLKSMKDSLCYPPLKSFKISPDLHDTGTISLSSSSASSELNKPSSSSSSSSFSSNLIQNLPSHQQPQSTNKTKQDKDQTFLLTNENLIEKEANYDLDRTFQSLFIQELFLMATRDDEDEEEDEEIGKIKNKKKNKSSEKKTHNSTSSNLNSTPKPSKQPHSKQYLYKESSSSSTSSTFFSSSSISSSSSSSDPSNSVMTFINLQHPPNQNHTNPVH